jgi:hypothetical protein
VPRAQPCPLKSSARSDNRAEYAAGPHAERAAATQRRDVLHRPRRGLQRGHPMAVIETVIAMLRPKPTLGRHLPERPRSVRPRS